MAADDLVILQGATWGVIIPVLAAGGGPADLAGWSVRSQVRSNRSSATVLHEWTTVAGNATIDESNVVLTVDADESSAWEWTSGVYDVELFQGDIVHRIKQGSVRVDPETTRG